MKLAILADIHGNLPAMEAALTDIDRLGVDRIIVNGDLVNGGPFSREVLDIVYARDLPLIRGNHEQYIINFHHDPAQFPLPQWHPVHWTHQQLNCDDIAFLERTPESIEFENLLIVHGAPGRLSGGIIPSTAADELAERYADVPQRFLITSHTHLPLTVCWQDKLVVNTGAVGASLDGNTAGSYVLATQCGCTWTIQHRRVAYDIRQFEIAAQERGYSTSTVARLHVREVITANIYLYPYLRRLHRLGLSFPNGEQQFPAEEATADLSYGHPAWTL
ncbi:MAG: metallophosphoesterase family protein [Chloroflexi bacterium]|nr:metallophosphoesterase family protein [Chloroflexota bacterium]